MEIMRNKRIRSLSAVSKLVFIGINLPEEWV
jgi:hypothetical protein